MFQNSKNHHISPKWLKMGLHLKKHISLQLHRQPNILTYGCMFAWTWSNQWGCSHCCTSDKVVQRFLFWSLILIWEMCQRNCESCNPCRPTLNGPNQRCLLSEFDIKLNLALKELICSTNSKCLQSILHSKVKTLEGVISHLPLLPRLEAHAGWQVEETEPTPTPSAGGQVPLIWEAEGRERDTEEEEQRVQVLVV